MVRLIRQHEHESVDLHNAEVKALEEVCDALVDFSNTRLSIEFMREAVVKEVVGEKLAQLLAEEYYWNKEHGNEEIQVGRPAVGRVLRLPVFYY